jgi:hypothetical protein
METTSSIAEMANEWLHAEIDEDRLAPALSPAQLASIAAVLVPGRGPRESGKVPCSWPTRPDDLEYPHERGEENHERERVR